MFMTDGIPGVPNNLNILFNNTLLDAERYNPDVIVHYDDEHERFSVTFIATNTGYFVYWKDLISADHKYTARITDDILSGCESKDELSIIFTRHVGDIIHLIWLHNCDCFN
jgi:hypothetical protein